MPEEISFKTESEIIIYRADAVELCILPEYYGLMNHNQEVYHRLIGEFFYCGLLLDGELILSEEQFNNLLQTCPLSLNIVKENLLFFHQPAKSLLRKLNSLTLRAHCVGDQEVESDSDENFLFHLLK